MKRCIHSVAEPLLLALKHACRPPTRQKSARLGGRACVRSSESLQDDDSFWAPDPKLYDPLAELDPPHSRSSTHSIFINVENHSGLPAELYWLDYQGKENLYRVIPAAQRARILQHTFASHPWTCKHKGLRLLVNGMSTYRVPYHGSESSTASRIVILLRIECPYMLPWTVQTHKSFPHSFKAAIRAFLLVRCRLGLTKHQHRTSLSDLPEEVLRHIIALSAPKSVPTYPRESV